VNRGLLPDLSLDLCDPRPRPLGRPRRFPLIAVFIGASSSLLALGDAGRVHPYAVIALAEANKSAESLPIFGPAATVVCEGPAAAVCELVVASGLSDMVRDSCSPLASVSGLSLVPSDELSIVGVRSQFLSPSTNMVVSSPLIEISLSQEPSIGRAMPRHRKLRITTSWFLRLKISQASPTHFVIITLILLAADCQSFFPVAGVVCLSARSTESSITCLRISLKGRFTDTSRGWTSPVQPPGTSDGIIP